MEEFLKAVGNFGFPMVVAGYLLLRQEKKTEALTVAIDKMAQSVDQNTKATNNLKGVIDTKIR